MSNSKGAYPLQLHTYAAAGLRPKGPDPRPRRAACPPGRARGTASGPKAGIPQESKELTITSNELAWHFEI